MDIERIFSQKQRSRRTVINIIKGGYGLRLTSYCRKIIKLNLKKCWYIHNINRVLLKRNSK